MSRYILSLDQGTTSSRAIIFDERSRVVAIAQREFRQIYLHSGWVEHDPQEIWDSQLGVCREVLTKAQIHPSQLAGLGITNQRETSVLWDRATGWAIGNAIVWQDRRTASLCAKWRENGWAEDIQKRTGLVPDPYFSAGKIIWLLDNIPGAREKAKQGELAFGTVDSWLLWNLTGGRASQGAVHATDVSNASRTMLYNIATHQWDQELLERMDIPRSLLPPVYPSARIWGHTFPDIFGVSIPIAGIAGDQQAALFGQRAYTEGIAKNTYGTGCFMLLHTGQKVLYSKHGLLSTIAAQPDHAPAYALEGSVFVAGAVIQWLRDSLGIILHASESEALAASVTDTNGVVLVPAFTGLGAPYWDAEARGGMLGLSRGVGRAHIVRAALESIALQSAEVLEAMQADAAIPLKELRVDGGASANNWLMQTQADLLGIPVIRCAIPETTALGAAHLAGLGVGVWAKPSDIPTLSEAETVFEPKISRDQAGHAMQEWRTAVERIRTK